MMDSFAIDGVGITELGQFKDDRGSVLHMIRNDGTTPTRFGECYFSEVLPGAIKAWKRHRVQTQNVAVPAGRVLLVIYDDRVSSPSRGKVQLFELGRPDAYMRVRIPPGLWYGFACIGATPALLANCTDLPHDPSESESRPQDDPTVPYSWASGAEGGEGSTS